MKPALAWINRLLPRSLVGRVFALYTLVLLGFVVAGLAAFYHQRFTDALQDQQERADSLSQVLLPTISDSAVIGDYDTIRRTLERAVKQSNFAEASFIDLRGGRVHAEDPTQPEVMPPDWLRRVFVERRRARLRRAAPALRPPAHRR